MSGGRTGTLGVTPTMLARPRLVGLLSQRWSRRFVTITAGAGFGKTTLLAAAIADATTNGVGADHLVELDPSCSSADELLRRCSIALGATLLDARALASHLDGLEPGHCLIFDDVHEVTADSEGAEILRDLVRSTSPHVHMVISARATTPLPLARARAADQVLDLGEHDMAFDPPELAAFAAARSVDPESLDGTGGWPALAALTAASGHQGALDYVAEEVIGDLEAKLFDALTCAVLARAADSDLLRDVVGFEADVDAVAEAVPLVTIDDQGALVPHQLWEPVIERHVFADVRTRILHGIAEHHRARGNSLAAIRAAATAGDTSELRQLVRDVGSIGHIAIRIAEIDRLLERAPVDFDQSPEGRLLRAISVRADDSFSDTAKHLLRDSAAEFRELGDVGCEVVATSELAFVIRSRGEADELPPIIGRMIELHQLGHDEVRPMVSFIGAALAEQTGDVEGALALLDEVKPGDLNDSWLALVEFQRCNHLLLLGRPREALAAAERSIALGSPGYIGGWCATLSARWHLGVTAELLDQLPIADAIESRSLIDRIWVGSWFGAMQAQAGRLDAAARNVAEAASCLRHVTQPEMIGFVAWANAVYAVADHDVDRARRELTQFFDAHPVDTPLGRRVASRCPALVDQLLDAPRRVAFSAATPGPWQTEMLRVSAALHDARSGRCDSAWPSPAVVLCALPVPWAVELAVRGAEFGHPQAHELATHLLDVAAEAVESEIGLHLAPALRPEALRLFGGDGHESRATIRVLGAIAVDGPGITNLDELRRRRVRELLAAIALGGPIDRERLGVLLWPDLDAGRVSSNLRVNLSYLNRIRLPDDATLITEAADGFVLSEGVHCDALEIERMIDAAASASRAGASEVSQRLLVRALDRVRGIPLSDTRRGSWFDRQSDRLTMLIVRAAADAASTSNDLGDHATARQSAELALGLDPYHEPAHRTLITAHVALGETDRARAAAEELLARLAELAVEPEPATVVLMSNVAAPS